MANMTLPYVADSDGNYTFSATATPIQIIDLAASILEAKLAGEALTDPSATERFLQLRLASLKHEVFACIFLDNRHRVIAFQELFRGTISCAAMYPREIVKGCDLDLMFGFSGVLASRTDRASPKIVATDLGSASTNVDSIQSPHPCLSSASPIGTSAV